MKTSKVLRAYPNSKVDLWDQNFINGEYVIAYELNPGLHPKLQSMLPKVCFSFKDSMKNFCFDNIRIKVRVYTNIEIQILRQWKKLKK